jgi:hypothetical protein
VIVTGGAMITGGVIATGGGSCAGIAGIKCAASQWCELPTATCNTPDMMGVCISVGSGACQTIYSPVCGCDGKTYSNDCERRNAKVSKQVDGACPTTVTNCGGIAGLKCPANQWCEFTANTCGVADQMGVCMTTEGGVCPPVYRPECGCDGKTYGSDCERRDARVSKLSDGACPTPDAGIRDAGAADRVKPQTGTLDSVCGGGASTACLPSLFCEYTAGTCGAADASGTCWPKGTGSCLGVSRPECGCDNKTYSNDCVRMYAGVALKSTGACP